MVDETTLDAAWFALKPFLAPEDCSRRVQDKGILPMNTNEILALRIAGHNFTSNEGPFFFYFTKNRLFQHLTEKETYYFRSNGYRNYYRTGYGNSFFIAQKLPFAKDMNITNRMEQDRTQSNIIIGIDIDAHNGETDVDKIQKLVNIYLGCYIYWEKSTNGNGLHGYIKFKYPSCFEIIIVEKLVNDLLKLFTKLGQKRAISAKLDSPCCLPLRVTYSTTNSYNFEMTPTKLGYPVIKRSQCLKIPRFNNSERSMYENVCYFHNLPFLEYSTAHLLCTRLYYLNKRLKGVKDSSLLSNSMIYVIKDVKKISSIISNIKEIPTETLHTISHKYKTIGNIEINDLPINTYEKYSEEDNEISCMSYDRYVREVNLCKEETDKLKKMHRFVKAYIRLYGMRKAVVDMINAEYVKMRLNTRELNSPKRLALIAVNLQYFKETFDSTKNGIQFNEWDELKPKFMEQVEVVLSGVDFSYSIGKDRKGKDRQMVFTFEDIAFILYAIAKTNYLNQDNEDNAANSFSHKQAKAFYLSVFKKPLHSAALCTIIKTLLQFGLIMKIGGYEMKVHGNRYMAQNIFVDLIDS